MHDHANNPYAAPQSMSTAAPSRIADHGSPAGRLTAWSIVFLLNLPICVLYASAVTTQAGRFGMVAGIATWYLATIVLVRRHPFFGTSWTIGGIVVGLSQFFPLAHILSGTLAVSVSASIERTLGLGVTPQSATDHLNALGAWFATILTGSALLALAAIFGVTFRTIGRVIAGMPLFRDVPPPLDAAFVERGHEIGQA